ncbi:hypothetical protein [Crocosphaera sp. Alani8]|uniref:hypothetical protein n=1 Tax=Crocosphaera sp. Alani8 TaxID=3038952 RepID=UPI00313AF12D
MYIVDEAEYLTKADPALSRIFINDNPVNCSFSPEIKERRIIYRYNFEITSPLLDAVIVAASNLGDTGCYFALAGERTGHESVSYVYLDFSDFFSLYGNEEHKDYEKISHFFSVENFVYSPQGLWGVLFSHESFGLIGGSPEFIETIEKLIPDINQQVYECVRYFYDFKSRHPKLATIEWLPELLHHVYGKERAKKILEAVELS